MTRVNRNAPQTPATPATALDAQTAAAPSNEPRTVSRAPEDAFESEPKPSASLIEPPPEPTTGAMLPDDGRAQSWSYTLQRGDDFWKLYKRFGVPVDELKRANPGVNSWDLEVGQQIRIPCGVQPEDVRPYQVEQGEQLAQIASRLGVSQSELLSLNKYLGPATGLRAGQVIYVPDRAQTPGSSSPGTDTTKPQLPAYDPTKFEPYVVKAGDTLWGISQRHGVSLADLKKANGHLPSFDAIEQGWQLLVPKRQSPTTDTPSTDTPPQASSEISLRRFPASQASAAKKAKYIEEAKKKFAAVDEHRAAIFQVAREFGLDPAFVAAIVSREWAPEKGLKCIGYDGCGRGMMQIDSRFHGEWLREHRGDWWKPEVNIRKGVEIFLDLKNEVSKEAAKQRMSLTEGETLACTVAAYNGWTKSVTSLKKYGHPDKYTTGGDYSADVLARAEYFRAQGYVF